MKSLFEADEALRVVVLGACSLVLLTPSSASSGPEAGPTAIRMTAAADAKPAYVTALEAAYGAPSQAGMGSAVFFERVNAGDDLARAALAKYRHFVGGLWERFGEQAWMGPWKEVHARKAGSRPDVVAELRGITDPTARQSVPTFLDAAQGAEKTRAALAAAFDDPAVTEARVFNLGDGEAMSGLLVVGRRAAVGEAVFVVFLMD